MATGEGADGVAVANGSAKAEEAAAQEAKPETAAPVSVALQESNSTETTVDTKDGEVETHGGGQNKQEDANSAAVTQDSEGHMAADYGDDADAPVDDGYGLEGGEVDAEGVAVDSKETKRPGVTGIDIEDFDSDDEEKDGTQAGQKDDEAGGPESEKTGEEAKVKPEPTKASSNDKEAKVKPESAKGSSKDKADDAGLKTAESTEIVAIEEKKSETQVDKLEIQDGEKEATKAHANDEAQKRKHKEQEEQDSDKEAPSRKVRLSARKTDARSPRGKDKGKGGKQPTKSLSYGSRKYRDDEVKKVAMEILKDDQNLPYTEIDFAKNLITARGLKYVADICRRCPKLRILKLFSNHINDDATAEFERIFQNCSDIEEVHLSHNELTEKGIEDLVKVADREFATREEGRRPLWLRVEHNRMNGPEAAEDLGYLLQDKFDSVCAREDPHRCQNTVCYLGKKIHVPFLVDKKRKGKGKGRDDGKGKDSGRDRDDGRLADREPRSRHRDRSRTPPHPRSRDAGPPWRQRDQPHDHFRGDRDQRNSDGDRGGPSPRSGGEFRERHAPPRRDDSRSRGHATLRGRPHETSSQSARLPEGRGDAVSSRRREMDMPPRHQAPPPMSGSNLTPVGGAGRRQASMSPERRRALGDASRQPFPPAYPPPAGRSRSPRLQATHPVSSSRRVLINEDVRYEAQSARRQPQNQSAPSAAASSAPANRVAAAAPYVASGKADVEYSYEEYSYEEEYTDHEGDVGKPAASASSSSRPAPVELPGQQTEYVDRAMRRLEDLQRRNPVGEAPRQHAPRQHAARKGESQRAAPRARDAPRESRRGGGRGAPREGPRGARREGNRDEPRASRRDTPRGTPGKENFGTGRRR